MTHPVCRIEVDGAEISDEIQKRLIRVVVYDEAGFKNDRMELTIDNREPYVARPGKGSVFTVYMGYDDLVMLGRYEFDEGTMSGPPHSMTIVAHCKDTGSAIKASKNRSWHNMSVDAIVSKISSDNGMSPQIGGSIGSKIMPHLDQAHQSDMGFLTDLARMNDAIVKFANNKVYFAPRDQSTDTKGNAVQSLTIVYTETYHYNYLWQGRGDYSGVKAPYSDKNTGKEKVATVGDVDTKPASVPGMFTSKEDAAKAAAGMSAELDRTKDTLELTTQGNPNILAETQFTIEGFPPGIPTSWLADRVQHTFESGGGYTTHTVAVAPTGGGDAAGGGAPVAEDSGGSDEGQEEKRDNQEGGDDGYHATEEDTST